MSGRIVNQIRIEQTRRQLASLKTEVQAWLDERRGKDKLQQYHTQLKVLEKALLGPLNALIGKLDAIDDTRSSGEVYTTCRARDQQVLLVYRVWIYFREKFNQRDDPRFKLVLEAADEVVWSCYTEVFRNLNAHSQYKVVRGPAPLPYIEPQYSAQARPRDDGRLPPDLRPDTTDDVLYEYLSQLPVPLVSLPPACVQEPWWFIYLGHEVGHHLQHDLVPGRELVNGFGDLLQTTAQNPPNPVCDARAAQRWKDWKEEIFADLCSIFSMGPWAIRAMAELEQTNARSMFSNKTTYPSSVVRLELLALVGDALGLNGHAALGDLQPRAMLADDTLVDVRPELRQSAANDMQLLPKMITAMLGPLPSVGRFTDFYLWNTSAAYFKAGGSVDRWAQQLLSQGKLYPDISLHTPRILVSAAMEAWMKASTEAPDAAQRDKAREGLKDRLLPVLNQSREAGVRATASIAEPDITRLDEHLTNILLERFPDDIE
jgi:hypothetical protein